MKAITSEEKDLEIDPRTVFVNAKATIRGDVLRGLVELLTNSDDSYKRLEARGVSVSGNINLFFKSFRNHEKYSGEFWVIDEAEGMAETTLQSKMRYGSSSSRLSSERGYFHRGLKEAIIGLGEGVIYSFKDDRVSICYLKTIKGCPKIKFENNLTRSLASEKLPFDIPFNGTAICVFVDKNLAKFPRSDDIFVPLRNCWQLRFIMQNPKRRVFARYLHYADRKKSSEIQNVNLSFSEPVSEIALERTSQKISRLSEYANLKGNLLIKKAVQPLTQAHEDVRDGGIIITVGGAPLDCTLGRFDRDPNAEKFFGQLEISGLRPFFDYILDSGRDGLKPRHPLTKEINSFLERALTPLVDAEKERKEQDIELESNTTKKIHKQLAKLLNHLAEDYLHEDFEPDFKGFKSKSTHCKPNLPDCLRFRYDARKIQVNKTETIVIEAPASDFPFGKLLNVRAESEDLELKEDEFYLLTTCNEKISYAKILVVGKKVGAKIRLFAECGDQKATCLIDIVSKKPVKKGKGLFNPPVLDDSMGELSAAAIFDEIEGIIRINTHHPVVSHYLGRKKDGIYEKQDAPLFRCLESEIVTDKFCEFLVKKKVERGGLSLLSSSEYDSRLNEINIVKRKYGIRIHKILNSNL